MLGTRWSCECLRSSQGMQTRMHAPACNPCLRSACRDVGTGAAVAISSDGWKDVVVWSPWTAMEACYKEFCCVERGVCDKPVEVKPGESWRARMDLSVVDL